MSHPAPAPDGPDAGLAWHYGDPFAEQRAMLAGDAVVRLENREVLEFSGADARAWLSAVTTRGFADLDGGVDALALSATGHIRHALFAAQHRDVVLVWTEPGRGSALLQWAASMFFAMRVEVRRRDLTIWWAGEGVPLPSDAPARRSSIGGREVFLPPGSVLDGRPAGCWAHEALRVAAGTPRVFVDTDERTIPNEIGMFATELGRGCYPGQEVVARVQHLGRPPRRLVGLHFDGSAERLPAWGAELTCEGARVGFVGSGARHHELGPIGLGLVKRSVSVDAGLVADGIAATQVALVDPEVGDHFRPPEGLPER